MKIVLTSALLLISCALMAQDKQNFFRFKPQDQQQVDKTLLDKYFKQKAGNVSPLSFVAVKEKQALVRLLPLDGMPCLFPDLSELNMPVVKLKATGQIPAAR